ncbi:hypothetical protein ATANTOWER_017082 [Ataeniobius toweri]|uniref:Uncharacterized protein n=1 Tax=Ataeniobius toweri TaxID=208326 RepID=A0ABU7A753_9TELE|nr:hypothetical protein [Ataeniobius toweri]
MADEETATALPVSTEAKKRRAPKGTTPHCTVCCSYCFCLKLLRPDLPAEVTLTLCSVLCGPTELRSHVEHMRGTFIVHLRVFVILKSR